MDELWTCRKTLISVNNLNISQVYNTTRLFVWAKQIIQLLYIVKVHNFYSLVKWKSICFADRRQWWSFLDPRDFVQTAFLSKPTSWYFVFQLMTQYERIMAVLLWMQIRKFAEGRDNAHIRKLARTDKAKDEGHRISSLSTEVRTRCLPRTKHGSKFLNNPSNFWTSFLKFVHMISDTVLRHTWKVS